jgi:hypothetical protein
MPKIATLSQGKTTVFSPVSVHKRTTLRTLFFSFSLSSSLFLSPRRQTRTHQTHTKDTHNQPCGKYFHSFSFKARERGRERRCGEKARRTRDSLVVRACARLFARVSVFGFGQLPFSLHFTCEMDHRLCFFPIHARNDDALLSSLTLALCSLINQQQ